MSVTPFPSALLSDWLYLQCKWLTSLHSWKNTAIFFHTKVLTTLRFVNLVGQQTSTPFYWKFCEYGYTIVSWKQSDRFQANQEWTDFMCSRPTLVTTATPIPPISLNYMWIRFPQFATRIFSFSFSFSFIMTYRRGPIHCSCYSTPTALYSMYDSWISFTCIWWHCLKTGSIGTGLNVQ